MSDGVKMRALPNVALNGMRIDFDSITFTAYVKPMPDNSGLEDLRQKHAGKWFFYWKAGQLFGLPLIKGLPALAQPEELRCYDHLALLAALTLDRLQARVRQHARKILRRRPFSFTGDSGELVDLIKGRLPSAPGILSGFKIRHRYDLNVKIIEPRLNDAFLGAFIGLGTRWDIEVPPSMLAAAGVDLRGLVVVRRDREHGERHAVGRIDRLDGARVLLGESYDGLAEIPESEVWVEGNKRNFAHCLRLILRSDYDDFETERRLGEAALLAPDSFDSYVDRIGRFLVKANPLRLAEGLEARVGARIEVKNTPAYESVRVLDEVEYCYNRARTKRDVYAWRGLERHGPFSPPARRTPRIAMLVPDYLEGQGERFVSQLRDGIVLEDRSAFSRGFSRIFQLVNPEYTVRAFPWRSNEQPAMRYRRAAEALLGNSRPDAAIVVIARECVRAKDIENPYLYAKATLLAAGVPVQSMTEATLSQSAEKLQYTLQNFSVALGAKLEAVPWTVEQTAPVADEIVLGLGSCELSDGRFGSRERFVGITTVFRGDGSYILSTLSDVCSYDDYAARLRESLVAVLNDIRARRAWQHGDKIRIVVHSFKPLKYIEIDQVAAECVALLRNDYEIQFAFVTVSHRHEFVVFDRNQPGLPTRSRPPKMKGALVPARGAIVEVGQHTLLVCATGPQQLKAASSPMPRPLLVKVHELSDFKDRHYLAEQVLRFTSLSWRSVHPSGEPVTILYSDLIARQLIRLGALPGWDPSVVNTTLRTSRWFL